MNTTLIEWNKNDLIILWDTEEAFEKMTPFYDKNSEQLDIEEMYVNIIKAVHDKLTAYITFNGLKKKRLFL